MNLADLAASSRLISFATPGIFFACSISESIAATIPFQTFSAVSLIAFHIGNSAFFTASQADTKYGPTTSQIVEKNFAIGSQTAEAAPAIAFHAAVSFPCIAPQAAPHSSE